MPSTCPKCRAVVAEDVVCCAEVVYTWKCKSCHKVESGFAIPYGKCFMCGGPLELVDKPSFEDPMRVRPIREAVEFELNSYHFYRLALGRVKEPLLRAILTELCEHELEHLRTLGDRYHTHLSDDVMKLAPAADELLSAELFRGIDLDDPRGGPLGLYDLAIDMEKRTRDHFGALARDLPEGPERDVCLELLAEEEEHVAMLETERQQFEGGPTA